MLPEQTMADAIATDDGGVEFITETQSDSIRLRRALQTNGDRPSNPGAWSNLSMQVPNDLMAACSPATAPQSGPDRFEAGT